MHRRFCQMEDMSANSFSPKHSWECYFTVVWNCHPSCLCNSNCHLCIHLSYMMQAHYSYFTLSVLILFQGHSVKVAVKLSLKKNPNLVRVVHHTLLVLITFVCFQRSMLFRLLWVHCSLCRWRLNVKGCTLNYILMTNFMILFLFFEISFWHCARLTMNPTSMRSWVNNRSLQDFSLPAAVNLPQDHRWDWGPILKHPDTAVDSKVLIVLSVELIWICM